MRHLAPRLSALALLIALGAAACSSGSRTVPSRTIRQVSFETRSEIPAGVRPVADAVLADLNGDRVPDLAVSALDGQVAILLGAGNGTFTAAQRLDAPGRPIKLAAADVDGDGDQDLAVLRAEAERVSVLHNDGGAGFTLRQELPTGPAPSDLAIGDCNGDKLIDLVVGHLIETSVLVFHGQVGGDFGAAPSLPMPGRAIPSALALGDVTGDGLPDLLVADKVSSQLVIFPALVGGGHGKALMIGVGQFPLGIAVGDLNADGLADIAVSNYDDADVSVLYSNGNGGFDAQRMAVDGPPGNAVIADVTGDSVPDLVLSVFERASISILPGLPGGGLGDEVQMTATGLPFRPLVGDVDGDGRRDLVVTAGGLDRLSLFRGRAGGLIGSINHRTDLQAPEFIAAADLDGDGVAEFAVTGRGMRFVSILRLEPAASGGPGRLRVVEKLDMGRPCFRVIAGDFNGDDRIDFAVTTDRGVKLIANRTLAGKLSLARYPAEPDKAIAKGVGPFDVAAADMDGDGLTDMVVTDAYAQKVTVLRATGPDFRWEPSQADLPVSGWPGGLAVADFDGDTRLDVAVARNKDSVVTVLTNTGGGRLRAWLDVPVAAGPSYLECADFDEDGRDDLLVSNGGVSEISVLFARPGGFQNVPLGAGATPTALLARDLNRDGHTDILVASLSGADFRVLLGNGSGGFPTQLQFPGTYKATDGALADLDGDGLPDLLVTSVDTTRVSIYRNVSVR